MGAELLRAWQKAASDLGIEVRPYAAAVLVPDFGSDAGTLCAVTATREEQDALIREAEALGVGYACLGEMYLDYDRDRYVDALNDWGWTGSGAPPPWYTGEPWTK